MGKRRLPAAPPPGPITSAAVRAVLRAPGLRPYLPLVSMVLPDVVALLDQVEAQFSDTVDEVLEQLAGDVAAVAKRAERTPRARGVQSAPQAQRRARGRPPPRVARIVDAVLEQLVDEDLVEAPAVRKYRGRIVHVRDPEPPATSPAALLPPASKR